MPTPAALALSRPPLMLLRMGQPEVEVERLSDELAVWHRYDSSIKAELFSTALATESGVVLVDPIEVDDATLRTVCGERSIRALAITNENHLRDSAQLAARFDVPVFAHASAGVRGANDLAELPELTAIAIQGAPLGEVALHSPRAGGTLIIGDALINFGPHEFAFLPAKYCVNANRMRKSLRQLLDLSFDRICFAHGTPITVRAKNRLLALLDSRS
ncbi:MAG: hypothetical protein M3Y86_01320 [Verrucomicrobiota bacterium]|nr:hypothetical protein [Verrucomicrobiota bacterium]